MTLRNREKLSKGDSLGKAAWGRLADVSRVLKSVGCALGLACLVGMAAAACGDSAQQDRTWGEISVALEGESQGIAYRLQDAVFRISGPTEMELAPGQGEAELVLELPAGDYTVELLEGWRLEQRQMEEWQAIEASLDMPVLGVSIAAGATVALNFLFEVGGNEVTFGSGELSLGIEVSVAGAKRFMITELMRNPTALSDAEGEWIEVTNAGGEPASLAGCELLRGGSVVSLEEGGELDPQEVLVASNSAAPGFAPALVYAGLTLPNNGSFELQLSCDGVVVHSVLFDPEQEDNAAGKSWALDPSWSSIELWCDGADQYAGDYGTPGTPNPPCVD